MKKKVALSATAIAVLASAVPAQVAPVEAEELMEVVHTKYITGNQSSHTGDGTVGSPFNLFEDAIKKVADGGTIIIHDAAFLNEVTKNNLPFIIDKNITIKSADGQHNTLEVRTPGIILGDNVKFENINLEFTNGFHDAIFANGHRLDLINVTKSPNTREIDLFAGTLYMGPYENLVLEPGTKGVINVEGGTYLNGKNDSKFGNIYAGSMNGNFEGTADITVSRNDATQKVIVGTIYGSGALQSTYNPDHFIGTTEPEAPEAMPDNFTVSGDVNVNLNDYQVPVDGATGTGAKTKVYTNSRNGNNLALKNVDTLEVNGGKVNLVSFRDESLAYIPNLKLANGTILGFGTSGNLNGNFTVDNYTGNGTVILRTDAKLTINNQPAEGSVLNLAVKEYFNDESGKAIEDTVHLNTPVGTKVTYTPHNTQSYLTLHPFKTGDRLEWKILDKDNVPTEPQPEPDMPEGDDEEELPTLSDISTDEDTLVLDVNEFSEGQLPSKTFLFNVYTQPESEEVWFGDYKPTVTVNGKQATLVDDDGEISYTADDLSFYFQPNYESDDLTSQQMVVQFNGEPTQETYEFVISADGVEPLTLTLNVEGLESAPESGDGEDGGELPPDEPDNTIPVLEAITSEQPAKSISMNSFEETVVPSVEFPFNMKTDKPLSSMTRFDQFNPTVKVDGKEAVKQVVEDDFVTYRVEGLDMTIYFELGDDLSDYNSQKMMVLFDDENGQPSPPTKKNYQFEISTEEVEPLQLTLTVEDLGTEEPDPVPPGEDGEDPDKPVPPVGGEDPDPVPDPEQPPTPGDGEGEGDDGKEPVPDPDPVPPVLPEPDEPEVENPSVTDIMVTPNLGTHPQIRNEEAFEITSSLFVATSKDLAVDVNEFDFYIGDTHATRVDGKDGVYTLDGTGITLTVTPTDTNNKFSLVMSGTSMDLSPGNYDLYVQVKGYEPKSSVYFDVLNPLLKATDIELNVPESLTTKDTLTTILIPVKLKLNYDGFVSELDYKFTLNDRELVATGKGSYKDEATGIEFSLIKGGSTGYQISISRLGESDATLPFEVGQYNFKATSEISDDFEFTLDIKESPVDPEPDKPSTEEPGNTGGNGGGSGQPTTPTPPTEPDNKEEEKEEPGTNNGGSSSGGTTLPAPDPKPEKPTEKPPVVEQPTPVPPQQEETKPTTRPTVKPGAIASAVEALEDLATTIKEKVDSLLTEVVEQAKGLVLDLTGDADDLSSVSTLDVTKDGIFANVDGEKVKFATDLKLEDIDMSKIRIIRADGSPIPYKTNGESFSINTHNFSDILITERVVEPFVDVSKDDWFQPYVDEAFNRGITTGTTASTFSPNQAITRAQAAVLLARMYELKPTSKTPTLKDSASQWYANEVQALVDNGIIKGYGDGTFRGEEEITREQLAVMLQRLADKQGEDTKPTDASKFTDTDKMSVEGKSAIQWAAEQGIINSGQGVAFRPKESTTRAQVAKMLTLFMNK